MRVWEGLLLRSISGTIWNTRETRNINLLQEVVPSYNIYVILTVVVEMDNIDFRWTKRDGPLWTVQKKL